MTHDSVNHPAHYTSHPSGVECIQITEHMGFNLGNALKYIWRADLKNDAAEDMRKAVWYIQREIEKREGKPTPQEQSTLPLDRALDADAAVELRSISDSVSSMGGVFDAYANCHALSEPPGPKEKIERNRAHGAEAFRVARRLRAIASGL